MCVCVSLRNKVWPANTNRISWLYLTQPGNWSFVASRLMNHLNSLSNEAKTSRR